MLIHSRHTFNLVGLSAQHAPLLPSAKPTYVYRLVRESCASNTFGWLLPVTPRLCGLVQPLHEQLVEFRGVCTPLALLHDLPAQHEQGNASSFEAGWMSKSLLQ